VYSLQFTPIITHDKAGVGLSVQQMAAEPAAQQRMSTHASPNQYLSQLQMDPMCVLLGCCAQLLVCVCLRYAKGVRRCVHIAGHMSLHISLLVHTYADVYSSSRSGSSSWDACWLGGSHSMPCVVKLDQCVVCVTVTFLLHCRVADQCVMCVTVRSLLHCRVA
jgi:hypothetical protein